jgi:hypothetical protein
MHTAEESPIMPLPITATSYGKYLFSGAGRASAPRASGAAMHCALEWCNLAATRLHSYIIMATLEQPPSLALPEAPCEISVYQVPESATV